MSAKLHRERVGVRGKNDPCYASEVSPKKKKRFELKKTSAQYSWDLDLVPAKYSNKYMDNFVSN